MKPDGMRVCGDCCHKVLEVLFVITPPQSRGLDSCEQPYGLPGASGTWLDLACLIGAVGVALLLRLARGAKLLLRKPHRGHRRPARPEACPMQVALSSTQLVRPGDGTRAFARPHHLGYRLLWRHAEAPRDMLLPHRPGHHGAAALPGPLTPHRPKQAPALALERLLPSRRETDHVRVPIPRGVAEALRRCWGHSVCSVGTAKPAARIRPHHLPRNLEAKPEEAPGSNHGLTYQRVTGA